MIHALHGEQDIRNMGGLKKHLPITYWTFLIGSLAIAGVPLLSGFFSKDEILFETFRAAISVLWVVGALTSLLTATYMFRLVFLTFHGEERFHGRAAQARTAHGARAPPHPAPAPGTRAPVHPRTVARAPARCAAGDGDGADRAGIGSVLAGYIGVPHALGGHNGLGTWLEPAFDAPATAARR